MKSKRLLPAAALLLLLLAALLGMRAIQGGREADLLTRDEALHIAVRDAGTRESMVYDVSVRRHTEGDSPVFRISFTDHRASYSYVVDAESGEILSRDSVEP